MDMVDHDVEVRRESAITALQFQAKELLPLDESAESLLEFGIEELGRWDNRTEQVIEKEIGIEEASRFGNVRPRSHKGDIYNGSDFEEATRARQAYLVSLIRELRDHAKAVFEREAKRVAGPDSTALSASQLQARMITALSDTRKNLYSNAERQARVIVRIVFGAALIVLLSTIVLLGDIVVEQWNTIEPIAWMVNVTLVVVGVVFAPRIPIVGKWLHRLAKERCIRRDERIWNIDTIEDLIRGIENGDGSDTDHG